MTARRLLLLLVAAVLMSLVLTPRGEPTPPPSDNETVAIEQAVAKAVPPIRAAGRPAADPGLLKVQSLAEMTSPEPVLVQLGEQDEDVPLVSRGAVLPVADDRGPPAGQAVL
ncbi:hypothetical protein ALI144C_40445 [Actinosynnema sp. ALI-1.44]|uniref:hypothetical protein n=1 Tax=Actinosynnema sp. ALI-1.44 TaxID=1933779 RepID=UPI00097C5E1E|nr:hypothetical protein [Actinosynnema sp. ALI-1.44]ONI75039.1 hypothetical protein ALI144C_40445 [Actinosynnema sp. ALI-1.44]